MSFRQSGSRRRLLARAAATLVVAIAAPTVGVAAEQGLILAGYNASFTGGMPMDAEGGVSRKTLCGPEGISALQKANQAVLDRLSARLVNPGLPTLGEMQSNAHAIKTELCQGDGDFSLQPHVITYSACRLTMDQHSIMTDMRMPTADTAGAMEVADFWKAEVMRVPLYPADPTATAAGTSPWASAIEWTGPGDTRQIAGYPATRWDFQYSTRMALGGGAGGMSVSVTTNGHGYFSKDVPGDALLERLYEGFATGVSSEQDGGAFFAGLMNTWVDHRRSDPVCAKAPAGAWL